jgi:hypothetical protein
MWDFLLLTQEGQMNPEFKKIAAFAASISGSRDRKYYNDYDEPPPEGECRKAIKGIQGEVSDQLAYTMASTELLVSIKQTLGVIAFCAVVIAAVAVRFAWANSFWS